MSSEFDLSMMRLALEHATRGRPSPNPHVGCVIVRDGEVIATGHHAQAGKAHAEIDALRKLDMRAEGATVYVTLEPCNHHGRTGPCSEALIRAGVSRVVVGCEDRIPGHGRGITRMREAGIQVEWGVLQERAEAMVADFYKHALLGLPYVTLKAAVTLDGRMATRSGDSRWITGKEARTHAHRLRDRSDAIMVGARTVIADDPALTVRHVRGRDPVRVVLDSALLTPPSARLFDPSSSAPVWIFHAPEADFDRRRELRERGALLIEAPRAERGLDLEWVLRDLARRNVVRLLVEGGPTLHGSFLAQGAVDYAAVFVAPRILGDVEARPLADAGPRTAMSEALAIKSPVTRRFGDDLLIEGPLEVPAANALPTR
ncbi:MAG: bifunctional diaminohydroxyphosphoribosylaminopyrimidine deaminase/5-amino-6-(5-phosphoribosylamino)uracil reductase RibD [Myxococcales bacterium]